MSIVLFHSFQHLPSLGLIPLKGFLISHGAHQGPSTSPCAMLPKRQGKKDTVRVVVLGAEVQIPSKISDANLECVFVKIHSFHTVVIDCKNITENWVSDQTWRKCLRCPRPFFVVSAPQDFPQPRASSKPRTPRSTCWLRGYGKCLQKLLHVIIDFFQCGAGILGETAVY